MDDQAKGNKCPKCGSGNVAEIVYGYPTPDAVEAQDRGEIELGGCVIDADDPQWICKNCENCW